jgi:GNAT superfamily N-acetyltransferase
LAKEQHTDFLTHPVPSLFDKPKMYKTAISQLEGLQREGLPGFPFPVSIQRQLLFHGQRTDTGSDGLTVAYCDFYEKIGSADELIAAIQLHKALSERGVSNRNLPQQFVAVTIFPSLFDAPDGIAPMPEDDEHPIGDHIVISLGFELGHLYFLNNWGPEWGVNGIGCFSANYLKHYWREAWSRRWLTGPWPNPPKVASDLGPSNEHLSKLLGGAWDQHETAGFFALHRGTVIDFFGRWLIGFIDGSVRLQCIAVLHEAEARPLLVGWMHIHGTPYGADVEELFVWPPYRERGIATALAGQVLFYAAQTPWQHARWRWQALEADTIMRQRAQRKPRIPSWLDHLISNPDNAMTNQAQFLGLLERLAKSRSLDGVHQFRLH